MLKIKPLALVTLFLGAIALGISQFFNHTDETEQLSQLDQNDWVIEHLISWQLTENNTLHFMQADSLRQHAEIVYAEQPRIILIKPNQQVFVRSQQAKITNDTLFEFEQAVHIEQIFVQNQTQETHHLNTEQLRYDQTTETISGPLAVTIQTPQSHTQGIGFDIDLTQQHTQIYSQVKTYYAPH